MPTIDLAEMGKWERGETEPWRIVRWSRGTWHNLLPKLFSWTTTPASLILGFIRLACAFMLALWPIWAKLYSDPGNQVSWNAAVLESAVTVGCTVFIYIYDRLINAARTRKEKAKLLERLSLDLSGTIEQFLGTIRLRRAEERPRILRLRKKLLEHIRRVAEIHLADYTGIYLEVTMLLFHDAACNTMRIAERATTQRPCEKVVGSADVMAYYVARSGRHRAVNDFRKNHPFPKVGISATRFPYRSILFIPLLDRGGGGPDTCLGVLTIDSSRPYHFWGGSGEDLVVKLSPYCAWLTVLLHLDSQHRLTCAQA